MTPTPTEAPCTDDLFESPRGETKDDVYRWVQEARCEPMAEHSRILADAILLTTRNGQSLRYPHEELRVYAEDGGLADTMQISAHVDIAWCAMLYGRASRVMTHLNSALLMGAALRQEVKPRLSAKGITFSNVLFVTEDSLEEAELKAASFFLVN